MRIGKISESVYKRSVLKQIHGELHRELGRKGQETIILAQSCESGISTMVGAYAVVNACNQLASAGATPAGVNLTILLPEDTEEPVFRELVQKTDAWCVNAQVPILQVDAKAIGAVSEMTVAVQAVGTIAAQENGTQGQPEKQKVEPGMDIIASKWIALEGTLRIAEMRREKLSTRYPDSLIDTAEKFQTCLSVESEAATAMKSGVGAMYSVSEGGIFGALWELAESAGVGLEIDWKKIPIRQESVEICEFFGVNPYELHGGGCLLMAAWNGNEIVREIEKLGISACIIGKATASNDRILMNEEECRYLEPSKTDELYKI